MFFLMGACPSLVESTAFAAIAELRDHNSLVRVQYTSGSDVDPDGDAVRSGMYRWTVDGVDYLDQQWFWLRVGAETSERRLDAAGSPLVRLLDTNTDSVNDTLRLQYTNSSGGQGYTVTTSYTLRGGATGSRSSDVNEQIRITNTSAQPLFFNFFQYSDFDLNGAGDSLSITGANTALQEGLGTEIAETVVTPRATHWWGADPATILSAFGDSMPTTLPDLSVAGTGNRAWAFEWTFTLPACGSWLLAKDKLIYPSAIPLPAALWSGLTVLAAVGVVRIIRRGRHF